MAYEFTFNFLRAPRFSAWHSWLPLTPVSEAPEMKEPERTLSKFLLSGIAVIELAVQAQRVAQEINWELPEINFELPDIELPSF